MPSARVEKDIRGTSTAANKRVQIGLACCPNVNNFNINGAISHIGPTVGNKPNEDTIQMQFFHYRVAQ